MEKACPGRACELIIRSYLESRPELERPSSRDHLKVNLSVASYGKHFNATYTSLQPLIGIRSLENPTATARGSYSRPIFALRIFCVMESRP